MTLGPRRLPHGPGAAYRAGRPSPAPRFTRPSPPRTISPCDGVLVVDKPAGPTSHDVVDAIRATFGFDKVGHGGTLDPQATGLLLVLVGRGTKLSDRFMGSDKVYDGTLCLGASTDTQDAAGNVTREGDFSGVTRDQLQAEMARLTGDMMQTPPMVSAVKINGVPLYKHARRGEVVERQPKLIHIYDFSLLSFEPPMAAFRVRCTKGTYVRTLCHDIGERLGCGAHLAALRRTQSGDLTLEQAMPLEDMLKLTREALIARIIPLARYGGH